MLNKLKDDILRLLKEDEEFRYAVVGLLGLQRLEEAVIELKNVVVRLADIQAKQEERLAKVEERLTKVEDRLVKIEERLEKHDRKFNEIITELRELRRISIKHDKMLNKHDKILKEIKTYMERTSLTLEEEAREVIAYRLREKGIAITNISSLILEDMEIDIYATDTNLCLIGEAKTRVGVNVVEKVDKDIKKLCRRYPNYLKDKVIKVIYGMQVLPDAVDEARKRGIWLVTANKEVTELNIR
jgi:chromosome segregation ATPase